MSSSAQELHRRTLKLIGTRFNISVIAKDSIATKKHINLAINEITRIEKLIPS